MARISRLIWLGGGLAATAAALAGWTELRSARLQSSLWSSSVRAASYEVQPGASERIAFPAGGPYDERLGYAALPRYIERLQNHGFAVTAQARQSPRLLALAEQGLFLPYREKNQAGLALRDCRGEALFELRLPQRQFAHFDEVPPLLVRSLLFIEDRHLLDEDEPRRNPALDPERLTKAALLQLQRRLDAGAPSAGGSTLATQIEKYRHSPQGRTGSVGEKLRQMASASQRAYLDGEETLTRRREILLDYLNTVPLAARPGIGEVHGLGDGLWAWYGREFEEFRTALQVGALPARALAFKQALSLLIAQRRPALFLQRDGDALQRLTDSYLRLLAEAGAIPPELRDAALPQALLPTAAAPQAERPDFAQRKATGNLRARLAALLDMPGSYELDRLDLEVHTSLDGRAQAMATRALTGLRTPAAARMAGLYGSHLLDADADLQPLVFSLTLYERGARANWLRVQTDNVDQPFDVNQGAKLDLGSTAKLRTLISYLEIVAELHARWAALPPAALRAQPPARDQLSAWARQYLLQAGDRGLPAMLDAALARRYSASPGEAFFTGGGLHRFENFEREHDHRVLTVREAFRHSVNLVFIRLMRDIVQHRIQSADGPDIPLADPDSPRRRELLARFADAEGSSFLAGFHRLYQGLTPAQARTRLLDEARSSAASQAALLYLFEPEADAIRLVEWLDERAPRGSRLAAGAHERYRRMSLADRAYLSGRHPLELWLVARLQQRPEASLAELLADSAPERQQAYAWLFKPRQRAAQDQRLRLMLEREAFAGLLQSWRRLGYPFDRLTPSYASAIGASGDRPAALAELMGIIVNDGLRYPTVRIEQLRFGAATPYETVLQRTPAQPERVLAPEIAATARRALEQVVEQGTARRLRGAFDLPDGTHVALGGKTGTGDNRVRV
ncbi:MAG TPA: transglycosylase domain-containing protein, partial [Roseateles sp.]|nr:transglycosylase domain-containing protein [Roseateles sp.]